MAATVTDGTTIRVYSNVSRTVGSLLEATDAPAVEDGIRIGFFEMDTLTRGELVPFHEALAPSEVRARFYPYPIPSLERLNEFAGGTKLGRMTRAYPSPLTATATDLGHGDTMTPQELLTSMFAAWATEFDWFTYKAVPDLRYRTPTGDYTSPTAGLVTFDAIVLEQDEEEGSRLSMRAILDRFLALFPGTAILMDSEGDLVLRPQYGPDAPSATTYTLSEADLVSISTGDADPRGVYNRARVRTRGGSIQDGVTVLGGTTAAFTRSSEDLTYLNDENLIDDTGFTVVEAGQWYPWSAAIVRGDEVTLDIAISLYALVWDGNPATPANTIVSHTLEVSDSWSSVTIPFGGSVTRSVTDKYEEGIFGLGGWNLSANITVEVNQARGIRVTGAWTQGPTDGNPYSTFATIVKVSAVDGDGYDLNLATTTGDFGYSSETLAGADGSDILAPSVDTWGERELEVNAEAFSCTPTQAEELAQALVLHHINPVTIRTCEQAWSRGFRVTPDDIGYLVQLPNGETGIVQRRDYSDDYRDPYGPRLSSLIEVAITEQAYASDGFILDDSGSFLRDDSGEQITEA